jgi:uncharacterized membrane protein
MNDITFALTLIAALGCGLSAGVFFAFSSFVMRALARLHPETGIAAMQAINVAAVGVAFMLALFGPAATCVALAGLAVAEWDEAHAGYLIAGSALYLIGVIALTIAYHVPRNHALAGVQRNSADAARQWARYVARWTAWNHVRVAAALAAAAALTLALHAG